MKFTSWTDGKSNGQNFLIQMKSGTLHADAFELASESRSLTAARFDPSGKYIFVGTNAGSILVFNTRTKTVSRFLVLLSVLRTLRSSHATKTLQDLVTSRALTLQNQGGEFSLSLLPASNLMAACQTSRFQFF